MVRSQRLDNIRYNFQGLRSVSPEGRVKRSHHPSQEGDGHVVYNGWNFPFSMAITQRLY